MTYNDLFEQALSAITSACTNVSNYGSISSHFKSGYSRNVTNAKATCRVSIINPVSSVSSSTVRSQLQSHLTNKGVALNDTVNISDATGLINFYTALASFCSAKVCTAASSETTNRYVIYNSSGSPTDYTRIDPRDVVRANDNITTSQTINQIISSNKKAYLVRYNISL